MPILVVDDEPFFRSAVNTILRRAGFHTIEARDGFEAYEIVRAIGASVELLLTDFQMPRMDGLSLIESVRELHPKMPVLLITGSWLENRPRTYAVLNKPIGREAPYRQCGALSPLLEWRDRRGRLKSSVAAIAAVKSSSRRSEPPPARLAKSGCWM